MSTDDVRDRLLGRIGQPMGSGGPVPAPDPVNLPMIRHWVDAFDDRNPVYLDPAAAGAAGFPGIVAPPTMLQAWTMPRPRIEGIRERGGAPGEIDPDTPVAALAAAGFRGTLATNSELEFDRYLELGETLVSDATLTSISELKGTGLGVGHFVEWMTTYRTGAGGTSAAGEEVGRQRFRIFKFDPTRSAADLPPRPKAPTAPDADAARTRVPGGALPEFALDVTATVIVAGALATRDFMPVHHDRDYAQGQGAPDIFMNILSTNAYLARYVTDWAGPRARLGRLAIRLGAPCVPGQVLTFTGQVTDQRTDAGLRHLEVAVRAANAFGDHATGTVDLTVPA